MKCKHSFTDYDETVYALPVQGQVEIESLLQIKFIVELVDELPGVLRVIFNLVVFDRCRFLEISKALGIPEITCRSHFFRARQIIQKSINENNREI